MSKFSTIETSPQQQSKSQTSLDTDELSIQLNKSEIQKENEQNENLIMSIPIPIPITNKNVYKEPTSFENSSRFSNPTNSCLRKVTQRQINLSFFRKLIWFMLILKAIVYLFNLPSAFVGTCNLYDCKFLNSQITKHFSPNSQKPCDNFYNYACAQVINKKINNHRKPFNSRRIEKVFREKINSTDSFAVRNMKHLFQLCEQKYSSQDLFATLNIEQWPLLAKDDAKLAPWETFEAEVNLLNIEALFFVNPKILNNTIIFGEASINEFDQQSFEEIAFGQSTNQSQNEIYKVYELNLELNSIAMHSRRELKYQELIDNFPGIKFDLFFKTFLEQSDTKKKNPSNYTFKLSIEYFETISKMFLENKFTSLNARNLILAKIIILFTKKSNKCLKFFETHLIFGYNLVFVQKFGDRENRKEFKRFVEEIKQFYLFKIRQSKSIDNNVRRWALKQVMKIAFIIGWPDEIDNEEFVSKLRVFGNCRIDTNQTFFNAFFCYRREEMLAKIKNETFNVLDGLMKRAVTSYNANYNGPSSVIYINPLVFTPPSYHRDYPPVINLAGSGHTIGHEIGHALGKNKILMNSYGFPKQNLLKFLYRFACFIKLYNNYSIESTFIDPVKTLDENLADFNGIQVVYEMYQRKLVRPADGDGQLIAPPGLSLNFSLNQLFFLHYVQMRCKSNVALLPTKHAPTSVRVLGSLSNMPEFAEAFQCPNRSPMRSLRQCQLWN